MLRIFLKRKQIPQENLDEGRKEDATNFVNKIPTDDTEKKKKYKDALSTFLSNPIADNKYLLWMLKHLEEAQDIDTMMSVINQYDAVQKNIESGNPLKDINNIKTFDELTGVVDDYSKSIKELESEGHKVIVSKEDTGGNFEVIRPLNVYASCKLGRNSRWCIAATKSKNYYKKYSKQNTVFYTIIDYTKDSKDENSMFTYAFIKGGGGKTEVYNTVDTQVQRELVQSSVGLDNELYFYQQMIDELGQEIPSTTLEKYNTFYSRIIKFINALPKYDNPYADLSQEDDEKYTDMEDEISDFYEDWKEQYENVEIPSDERKQALRQMVLFTKKLSSIDNILAKYKIGVRIRSDFVYDVPELEKPMIELLRDPKWIQTANENFADLSDSVSNKDFFNLNREKTFSRLFQFSEQAIFNNQPQFLENLYDTFNNVRKKLNPSNDPPTIINKYEYALESIIKPAVYNYHPDALKYLIDHIDNNSGSPNKINHILFSGYSIAYDPSLANKYANGIFDHVIKKYTSDERYETKVNSICNMIAKIKGLEIDKYEFAIDKSDDVTVLVNFAYYNNINILDPEYQEKVANKIIRQYQGSGPSLVDHTLANSIYSICLSDSLPKETISKLLNMLFAGQLYRNLNNNFKEQLFKKWGEDNEINSPQFKEKYAAQNNLTESRLFIYDKEHNIYRTTK